MSLMITTSWDDGYALDLRVAEMLTRHGLTGTFYVCPKQQYGQPMLMREDLRALAGTHEIGAHTLTHPRLTECPDDSVREELTRGKAWIEDTTGKPCTAFCYPKGAHDARVRRLTKDAGYTCARTCETLQFHATDRFALPVSLQVFPFPWRKSFVPLWKLLDPLGPLRVQAGPLNNLRIPWSKRTSWLHVAEALLEHAVRTDAPFFHLYGHSREVEAFGMWNDLETFMRMLGGVSGAKHVTNTALSSVLKFT